MLMGIKGYGVLLRRMTLSQMTEFETVKMGKSELRVVN